MSIIGNWKTQEAKNKIIHDHKHFTDWHVLLSPLCVSSQLSYHFYVIKIIHVCIMLFHTRWIFTILSPKAIFVSNFNNSFLCLLHSGMELSHWVFIFAYNILVPKFSFGSLYSFDHFIETLIFFCVEST